MTKQRAVNHKVGKGAGGLAILVAVSIGVAACGSGARGTSSGMATVAHPAAIDLPSAAPAIPAATNSSASQPAAGTTSPARVATSGTAHGTPGAPTTAAPTPAPTAPAAPATTGTTLPPRTQPTAAEVDAAIEAVHQLVPFFTPTAAQVAKVGNEVCTAFDQGMTFSQVKSKVSSMLGSFSWLLPSSAVTEGVRTVVSLYCPGYASKVA